MKMRVVTVACLVLLLFLAGCELVDPYKLHPPAWIWGEWAPASDTSMFSFTFTETTVLETIGLTTLDLGELYKQSNTNVTETITDTVYAFRVPAGDGYMRMKFDKVDSNTLNYTLETNLSTTGPVPLQRL
ncbi:MAG: hypothetical protein ABFD77_00875 [Thermotogota bacterium]